jgi:hypothetical protein
MLKLWYNNLKLHNNLLTKFDNQNNDNYGEQKKGIKLLKFEKR